MRDLNTSCGLFHGVSRDEYYKSGSIKECTLVENNSLTTPLGTFVPQYEDDGVRRKFTSSLSFYESGALKKLSLQSQTLVKTPIGDMPAELVTFYESSALKRLFPLNGKLGGYWSEKNEYDLAQQYNFKFSFGDINNKVICVHFYESGAVKSLTFWPRENVRVKTPIGEIDIRIGISFYEDGKIKSVEPKKSVDVPTQIGIMSAFDIDAIGITGDQNSLLFSHSGKVERLKTASNMVTVKSADAVEHLYEPFLVRSHFSDENKAVLPLDVWFLDYTVCFGNCKEDCFDINKNKFTISKFALDNASGNECDGCE
jgi:antitoxin component YwqK of YwqJK toxin-antitoxin module